MDGRVLSLTIRRVGCRSDRECHSRLAVVRASHEASASQLAYIYFNRLVR